MAAIQSCQRVWLQWIADGDFSYHQNKEAKEDTAAGTLAVWMNKQYIALIKTLLEQLRSGDAVLQAAALHVLLSFVKSGPAPGELDNSLLAHVVRHTFCNKHFKSALLEPLIGQYVTLYDDVAMLTLNGVRHVLQAHSGSKAADDDTDEEDTSAAQKAARGSASSLPKVTATVLSQNVLEFLLRLRPPKMDHERPSIYAAGGDADIKVKTGKRKDRGEKCSPAELKKAAGRCWMQFLQMSHPKDVYKRVLLRMDSHVLRHLQSPLMLSDFLTRSYNIGGYTSVLALNGLFELITRHNLEYPMFYEKLYQAAFFCNFKNVLFSSTFLFRPFSSTHRCSSRRCS